MSDEKNSIILNLQEFNRKKLIVKNISVLICHPFFEFISLIHLAKAMVREKARKLATLLILKCSFILFLLLFIKILFASFIPVSKTAPYN